MGTPIVSVLLPTGKRPTIVGEDNPHGSDPRQALFPSPERSAGYRLCVEILGLVRAEYLQYYDRVNLCTGRWSAPEARKKAAELVLTKQPLILLGRKVCNSFAISYTPFEVVRVNVICDITNEILPLVSVVLPHPSGRCRLWQESYAIKRARAAVASAGLLVAA